MPTVDWSLLIENTPNSNRQDSNPNSWPQGKLDLNGTINSKRTRENDEKSNSDSEDSDSEDDEMLINRKIRRQKKNKITNKKGDEDTGEEETNMKVYETKS